MIELSGIHKSFSRPVLCGVDLHVDAGCLYGLVGPGAAGKSVLLKIVAGLVVPDAGRVVVDGCSLGDFDDVALQRFRGRYGMLFQNNALFDFMTVYDNVAFPLRRLFDLEEAEIRERVYERLERVGLAGFGHRYPSGLSGGQKKRVGIARATVSGAPLVLYDEPAAGLDPVTTARIFELLRREQIESGSTVIMVSSDLDRLLTVTDRVGMMLAGRLIFDGTTEETKKSMDPYVRQFFDGSLEGPL